MEDKRKDEPDLMGNKWTGAELQRVGFGETCRLIASDYRRICEMMGGDASLGKRLFWLLAPNVVALALFRVSHFFHTNHLRFLAWPVYLLNIYTTGADIPPSTVIGERCFLGHVRGTVICGVVGKNALLFAAPGIGGGMGMPGEGRPANGLPIIGDNVMVGARAMVLGPIFVGDGATIGAGAVITRDLPAMSTAVLRPPQVLRTSERSVDFDAMAGTDKP